MGKGSVSWSKLWSSGWVTGVTENTRPVAMLLLLVFSTYFLLDAYLFLVVVGSSPPNVILPLTTNSTESPCYASPFCYLNAKSLFLDPVDFYLHKSVALMLNRALSLASYVSADFVSVCHILLAMCSSRLIAHESLCIRRIGVLLFELRNMFDSLDGIIARAAAKLRAAHHHVDLTVTGGVPGVELPNTSSMPTGGDGGAGGTTGLTVGYFVDGICDGIGCIFLLLGCFLYLQRHPYRKTPIAYSPLSLVTVGSGGRCGSGGSSSTSLSNGSKTLSPKTYAKKQKDECDSELNLKSSPLRLPLRLCDTLKALVNWRSTCNWGFGMPAVLYLNQLLLSSLFWNRNILIYSRILEGTPGDSVSSVSFKSVTLHSKMLWAVMISWRLINPLNMTEILLAAIFFDRMADLLQLFQYSGFAIISAVAAVSELHRHFLETE